VRRMSPAAGRARRAKNQSPMVSIRIRRRRRLRRPFTQLRANTDRDANDVRPGHKLAKAQGVRKFFLACPSALLDGDAARPDEPATEAAERDGDERSEQRHQRNGPRQVPLCPISLAFCDNTRKGHRTWCRRARGAPSRPRGRLRGPSSGGLCRSSPPVRTWRL
jgi:hypothetical protein